MAHTNSTANYELSQFLGTDKPAWLVDYNGDMLKIDTALKANADAEAASAEDIQELQDAIGAEGLTGRITDIENDIGDIKTEIGSISLPTTAQSLTGAIAELKGVNDDQNTAIGLNATNIAQVGGSVEGVAQLAYTIANVYDSSATYAVGAYAIYQNTLYKCTTAINVGETFDPSKWTSVKVMSEVGQGGGGSTSASNVSYVNTSSGLAANNVQAAIDEVVSDIPDNAAALSYNNTISGLSANNVQAAIDEIASSEYSSELGSSVNLTSYNSFSNSYTFPSDGYVRIEVSTTHSASIAVYGSNATSASDPHPICVSDNYIANSMFVRKGMKCYIVINSGATVSSAIFIPFI